MVVLGGGGLFLMSEVPLYQDTLEEVTGTMKLLVLSRQHTGDEGHPPEIV